VDINDETKIYNCLATNTAGASTITHSSFNGGGIFMNSGELNINRSTISNCSALNGGGVYALTGTFNMNGATISNNTVSGTGGGVYIGSGCTTTMSFCQIEDGNLVYSTISGNKAMAIVYSGDASYIMTENENLEYFTPEQGTNIWYDAMVMMKTCNNTDLAHSFINFMLDEENALSNSETVGYSSSVASAFKEMQKTVYNGINAYVPRTNNKLDEIFKYQSSETKKFCSELWIKVKSN